MLSCKLRLQVPRTSFLKWCRYKMSPIKFKYSMNHSNWVTIWWEDLFIIRLNLCIMIVSHNLQWEDVMIGFNQSWLQSPKLTKINRSSQDLCFGFKILEYLDEKQNSTLLNIIRLQFLWKVYAWALNYLQECQFQVVIW